METSLLAKTLHLPSERPRWGGSIRALEAVGERGEKQLSTEGMLAHIKCMWPAILQFREERLGCGWGSILDKLRPHHSQMGIGGPAGLRQKVPDLVMEWWG